jgi:hypothetical protein
VHENADSTGIAAFPQLKSGSCGSLFKIITMPHLEMKIIEPHLQRQAVVMAQSRLQTSETVGRLSNPGRTFKQTVNLGRF